MLLDCLQVNPAVTRLSLLMNPAVTTVLCCRMGAINICFLSVKEAAAVIWSVARGFYGWRGKWPKKQPLQFFKKKRQEITTVVTKAIIWTLSIKMCTEPTTTGLQQQRRSFLLLLGMQFCDRFLLEVCKITYVWVVKSCISWHLHLYSCLLV